MLKADGIDLIRFRRSQHLTGKTDAQTCRLCEEEELSDQLGLLCPTFMLEWQNCQLGVLF